MPKESANLNTPENISEVKSDHTGHLRGHLTGLPSDEVYIFLDYLRNGRGTTAIGTYSPRARDGFPIAAVPHRVRHPARSLHDEQSISCKGGGMMRAGLCQAIAVFWHSLAQSTAHAFDRKGFLLVDL